MNPENRRSFLKQTALAGAGLVMLPDKLALAKPFSAKKFDKESLVSVQMGPHSLLDEGIPQVLDFLQQEAAMNSVMVYSHTYYGVDRKPSRVLAHDHGIAPRDLNQRNLRMSWVKHHEKNFKDTIVRHQQVDSSMEYYDRDLFKELIPEAHRRGMKVYIRMLEAGANRAEHIKNYDKVMVEDVYGRPGGGPCWNNPDYRNWVYATMEDIFTHYDIDGLQYGAERTGPMSMVWFRGEIPACFCEHCRSRNEAKNIDPLRAREGYRKMYEYMQRVEAGKDQSPDTVMVNLFRFMQEYPEIMSWNYQWFQADEEIQQEMYRRLKDIKPNALVGRHVDHQRSSWDIFYRSAISYANMAEYADFIKPILYHDIYGPRLRWWVIDQWQSRAFKDFSHEQTLDFFYQMMGYSPAAQVPLDELEVKGMGPAYVYDETKRCVDIVDGKTDVVAGIGIDVLWHGGGMQPYHSDPRRLQQAVYKAVEAGASGILASREYDEMRYSSLRAFGDAVRQLQ
jgi:hypothetical protein